MFAAFRVKKLYCYSCRPYRPFNIFFSSHILVSFMVNETKHFQVFTSIFTLECIMKVMAMSKDFFACGWNIFDLIIVSASLLDLIFELVDGLSVLRGLRLVSYI